MNFFNYNNHFICGWYYISAITKSSIKYISNLFRRKNAFNIFFYM